MYYYFASTTTIFVILSFLSLTLSIDLEEAHKTMELLVCTCTDGKHTHPNVAHSIPKYDMIAFGYNGDKEEPLCGVAVPKRELENAIQDIPEPHYVLRYKDNENKSASIVEKALVKGDPVLIFDTDNDLSNLTDENRFPVYFKHGEISTKVIGHAFLGNYIYRPRSADDGDIIGDVTIVFIGIEDMEEKGIKWEKVYRVTREDGGNNYPIIFPSENIPGDEKATKNVVKPTQDEAAYIAFLLEDIVT